MSPPVRATDAASSPVPGLRASFRGVPIAIAFGVAVIVAIAALIWSRGSDTGEKLATVEMRKLSRTIHAPGRIEAARAPVRVSARSGGIVKAVPVAESQTVAAGALLAQLEDDEAQAQLKLARADLEAARASERRLVSGARAEELDQARARLEEAEAERSQAHSNRERMDALFTSKAVTRQAREEAQRAEEQAGLHALEARRALDLLTSGARTEERRAAMASVEAAEARVALAELQIEQRALRAPFTGTVLAVFAHPGDAVAPLQPVVLLADLSLLQARAEVDELNMGGVRVGQSACVRADAYPGLDFCGKVLTTSQALGRRHFEGGNPGGNVQDLKVMELTTSLPTDSRLVAGMGVEVLVDASSDGAVPAIPLAAAHEREGKSWVTVAEGRRRDERQVELGNSDGVFYEVKSGLKAGEHVLLPR